MSETTLPGTCLCGAVAFTVTGNARRFFHCHCSRCRKVTGTGHASNLFLKGSLDWHQGAEDVITYRLPDAKRFGNSFCRHCGSRLPRFDEASGVVMVPAGSLDAEPPILPEARIFAGSRTNWSCSATEIPEHEEYVQ